VSDKRLFSGKNFKSLLIGTLFLCFLFNSVTAWPGNSANNKLKTEHLDMGPITEEPDDTDMEFEDIAEESGDIDIELADIAEKRKDVDYKDFYILGPTIRSWVKTTEFLQKSLNLEPGIAYTILYQLASIKDGTKPAAGGNLDIFGRWHAFGKKNIDPAYLGYKAQFQHSAGFPKTPAQLGSSVGSAWGTTDGFDTQRMIFSELWWEQYVFNGLLKFRIGKVDQSDFFGTYYYCSDKLYFMNFAFSDNPAIPYPASSFGGVVKIWPTKYLYLMAGMGDTNTKKTELRADTFFKYGQFFKAFETGIEIKEHGLEGSYAVTLWHSDGSDRYDEPAGFGVAMNCEQEIYEGVVPFFRYAYADKDVAVLNHFIAGGVCLEGKFGRKDDILGIGFSWGKPSDKALKSQMVAELFYRIELNPFMQLTPGYQLIIKPADAPQNDVAGVFELRFRAAF